MCAVCVILVENVEADLTWLYLLGGFFGFIIIAVILIICCCVKDAKDIEDEVMAERAAGITKSWGTRTELVFRDADGNVISSPNKVAAGVADDGNLTANES